MFILQNTTTGPLLVQDQYLSQPFDPLEAIDMETIWSFEQLHKSTYYSDGAIRAGLTDGSLLLISPTEGYKDPIWRFSAPRIEYIVLTQEHIDQKKVSLAEKPNKSMIALDVLGGISQYPDIDFTVFDKDISWNSLGLDGLLEAGDTLRVIYGSN